MIRSHTRNTVTDQIRLFKAFIKILSNLYNFALLGEYYLYSYSVR